MHAARRKRRSRLGRLRRGEAFAALSGLLLLAFTFFAWYGTEVSGQVAEIDVEGAGGSAWQTLEPVPVVLALTAVVAIGAAILRASGSSWRPAIAPAALVTVLGGLSALLILFRIVFPPDLGELGGIGIQATLELGIFLALAAAIGVAYGGYRAMGEEGTSFARVAETLSR